MIRMRVTRSPEGHRRLYQHEIDSMAMGSKRVKVGVGLSLLGDADAAAREATREAMQQAGLERADWALVMVSTVALGDPDSGIACAVVTTGLLDPMTNARRLREVTGTAIRAIQSE